MAMKTLQNVTLGSTLLLGAMAPALALTTNAIAQDAVQWRVEDGGNGNWYRVMPHGAYATWTDAAEAAAVEGGHLATLTTAEELSLIHI